MSGGMYDVVISSKAGSIIVFVCADVCGLDFASACVLIFGHNVVILRVPPGGPPGVPPRGPPGGPPRGPSALFG